MIENLFEFRNFKNAYVDSILNITNSKFKFKIIHECKKELVDFTRRNICREYKLNIDQEIVLNEVSKWFLPAKDL